MFGNPFARPQAPEGPPLVLFVCTGNICRSPLAEKLVATRLDEAGSLPQLLTSSAGLHAVVGSSMDTMPALIAQRHGADPAHVARQIDSSIADSASLILTMTVAQLNELVVEYPSTMKRAFTFAEFVEILEQLPDSVPPVDEESGRSLFDVAIDAFNNRSLIPRDSKRDIDDPYRRSIETHERVGSEIAGLSQRLSARLVASSTGK
ncbi:hypothetical protein [Herbiconiux sp. A18JL235]|uniref:Phosphotyrosine protein phosphatase I domain-containing protein n=1 Tax=Herbiconiux sp. A18JL235 TaxID=3152363 RepID=A0AB39BJR1_9MICO